MLVGEQNAVYGRTCAQPSTYSAYDYTMEFQSVSNAQTYVLISTKKSHILKSCHLILRQKQKLNCGFLHFKNTTSHYYNNV